MLKLVDDKHEIPLCTIVPAEPDWYLLEWIDPCNRGSFSTYLMPIVAWRIDGEYRHPIACGFPANIMFPIIVDPDGGITDPDTNRWWQCVEDYVEAVKYGETYRVHGRYCAPEDEEARS